MTVHPEVVVLDVNQTLSDTAPLAERFAEAGAPGHLAQTWFASVLRDGFGLAAAGALVPFAEVAAGLLTTLFTDLGAPDVDAAVHHVLDGLASLEVHPDVPPGLQQLREAGVRVVALTNSSTASARSLLDRAGVLPAFEQVLSVEDAGRWKPAPQAYAHALQACGVRPEQALLAAVHPWDVDGAARAGLQTAWVDRDGAAYPAHLTPPGRTVDGLPGLAAALAR